MTEDEKEKPAKKKGEASFRIPIWTFMVARLRSMKAHHIGAYLTLARYTEESGKLSTAGYNAIHNALGVTGGKNGRAAKLVNDLCMTRTTEEQEYLKNYGQQKKRGRPKAPPKPEGLIYAPEEWRILTGEEMPEAPHERAAVRWVINDFGGKKWIWFGANLVDGVGRFRQPLRRLKQCGDVAARALLLMYAAHDIEQWGGVRPCGNVYRKYDLKHLGTTHGFSFYKAEFETDTVFNALSIPALGIDKFSKNQEQKENELQLFFDAVKSLDSSGFIYEMVTVMDGPPDEEGSQPMYELHAKSRHGHPPKGEEGMAARIDRIFQTVSDQTTADSVGRFRNTYPVISRTGIRPHVTGVYRLRLRVSNPKNYTVTEAFKRIHRDRREAEEWCQYLESRYDIDTGQKEKKNQDHVP